MASEPIDELLLKPGEGATDKGRRHTGNANTAAAYFGASRELTTYPVISKFTIDGEPSSKARARFTNYGGKVRAYTPEKTKQAENIVAWKFRAATPGHKVSAEASYGVVALFFNGTRQRRDVDNMTKLILDGLNKVAWADDDQVIEITARKDYVPKHEARTEVLIYRIGDLYQLTKPCKHCSQEFKIWDSLIDKQHFCSAECRKEYRVSKRLRICKNCKETFLVHGPERATIYCSRECNSEADRATLNCTECGNEFTRTKSFVRKNNFCTPECSHSHLAKRRTKNAKGSCADCGGPTSKKQYIRCRACNTLMRARNSKAPYSDSTKGVKRATP